MKALTIIISLAVVVLLTETMGVARSEDSHDKQYIAGKEILADIGGQTLKFTVLSPEESARLKYTPLPLDTKQLKIGSGVRCNEVGTINRFQLCRQFYLFCEGAGGQCVNLEGGLIPIPPSP